MPGNSVVTPLWIEFVGLPGAGKSTITTQLIARLEEAGYRCRTGGSFAFLGRGQARGHLWRGIWALSDLVEAIGFVSEGGEEARRPFAGKCRGHMAGRYWRLMRTRSGLLRLRRDESQGGFEGITVFDQGVLQALRSIHAADEDEEALRSLTRWWIHRLTDVLPHVVVRVIIDEKTVVHRLRSRPFQRTTWDLSSPTLAEELKPVRIYVERILPDCLEGMPVVVLDVDGELEPVENAATIQRSIQALAT